ncbi:MAG: hypothetical protein ACJAS1_005268 [Oleiphilaceae bacterium]|jgi:uncharacterized protein YjiS (DUF1127 family)
MSTNTLSMRLPELFKSFLMEHISLWVKTMVARIRIARSIARQRRSLAQLDSSQLKDIDISRYDADFESSKGYWDIPENLQ